MSRSPSLLGPVRRSAGRVPLEAGPPSRSRGRRADGGLVDHGIEDPAKLVRAGLLIVDWPENHDPSDVARALPASPAGWSCRPSEAEPYARTPTAGTTIAPAKPTTARRIPLNVLQPDESSMRWLLVCG